MSLIAKDECVLTHHRLLSLMLLKTARGYELELDHYSKHSNRNAFVYTFHAQCFREERVLLLQTLFA